MTRTRFHQGLDDLREKLLTMSGMVEQALDRAVQAFVERDPKLAEAVYRGEDEINRIEKEIDELAFDLLAMQQPMAVDLRLILAVTKINADLERMGDQAVNIAERAEDSCLGQACELPVDLRHTAELARNMTHQALRAFVARDAELGRQVLKADDEVDALNREAFKLLLAKMVSEPANSRQWLDALLVSRNLERVADHATNIAEDVIFWLQGADVRHGSAV